MWVSLIHFQSFQLLSWDSFKYRSVYLNIFLIILWDFGYKDSIPCKSIRSSLLYLLLYFHIFLDFQSLWIFWTTHSLIHQVIDYNFALLKLLSPPSSNNRSGLHQLQWKKIRFFLVFWYSEIVSCQTISFQLYYIKRNFVC